MTSHPFLKWDKVKACTFINIMMMMNRVYYLLKIAVAVIHIMKKIARQLGMISQCTAGCRADLTIFFKKGGDENKYTLDF